MKDSISYFEKINKGSALIDLGYRDYIAARVLLNKHLLVQGLTLASTSVEKYLKAIIVLNLKKKEHYHYHLDRFESLKKLLSKLNNDVTEEFDSIFLDILQNAFRIRYYDKINRPIFMGFYINQFIGELDFTVDFMEKYIYSSQNGGFSMTKYFQAIENNDTHLYENNYILKNENKKEFMERSDIGFSIYINTGPKFHRENVVKGGITKNKYDGEISKFTDFSETIFSNNRR
ncbi:hypothetical protein [Flagellimonas abyssi]|uniref:HEPN domain-containing protein n=1 Tax=Flagellimonas abyssi TaxID=2864871 RepID=A0ABS7EMH6_9FLAO|nr:hypothetical protein [Allomuricauda abyssi]MBW8198289.1 hypothetical protein [Allomuricauda abyssi]